MLPIICGTGLPHGIAFAIICLHRTRTGRSFATIQNVFNQLSARATSIHVSRVLMRYFTSYDTTIFIFIFYAIITYTDIRIRRTLTSPSQSNVQKPSIINPPPSCENRSKFRRLHDIDPTPSLVKAQRGPRCRQTHSSQAFRSDKESYFAVP